MGFLIPGSQVRVLPGVLHVVSRLGAPQGADPMSRETRSRHGLYAFACFLLAYAFADAAAVPHRFSIWFAAVAAVFFVTTLWCLWRRYRESRLT